MQQLNLRLKEPSRSLKNSRRDKLSAGDRKRIDRAAIDLVMREGLVWDDAFSRAFDEVTEPKRFAMA